jgi:hypothetical protein
MLGEEEAQISVFEPFKLLLLPYEIKHYHDERQLLLTAFLCVYHK